MKIFLILLIVLTIIITLVIIIKNKNLKNKSTKILNNKTEDQNTTGKINLKDQENNIKTRKIGDYEVIKFIGEGATSKVFLVKKGNSLFALKQLNIIDEEFKKRFEREIAILKELKHKNIVSIIDSGIYEEKPFIVIDYVDGDSLDRIATKLNIIQKIDILISAANGIAYLHSKGIIHRDIKPENILVSKDLKEVKIADLGISKVVYWRSITQEGQILGTPAYMAPELFEGKSDDPKIDIYSFGITMYEVLTHNVPFDGKPSEIILKHIKEEPKLPSLINPEIPQALDKIIMKCIEKKPERRYKSMLLLIEDLITVRKNLITQKN
ncbi:MAG: serine/threonine-protein kinase [bacterium]